MEAAVGRAAASAAAVGRGTVRPKLEEEPLALEEEPLAAVQPDEPPPPESAGPALEVVEQLPEGRR